jgi:hypothetical protein
MRSAHPVLYQVVCGCDDGGRCYRFRAEKFASPGQHGAYLVELQLKQRVRHAPNVLPP